MLTTPQRKNGLVTKHIHEVWIWTEPLARPKQRKRGMRFGTRNVRSLHRSGSLTAAVRELARYKLDLVSVQEVRWDKGDTVTAGD